jgi:hypothetical protein
MGQGLPFRAGSFDGAISISALQWLCNADKKSHNPIKRMNRFFTNLYSVLVSEIRLKLFFLKYDIFIDKLKRIEAAELFFNYIQIRLNK